MAPTTATYKIPSVNLDKLYQEIEKLNKRAKRNGLAPITVTEVGTEIVPAEQDRPSYIVYLLQIAGESPIINGWQFLAIIEHIGRNTIIRALPGVAEGELVAYRGASAVCEHCNKRVYRKYSAVLKNESGEYKQVGKSCLKDFTGHKQVTTLASIAEEIQKALKDASELTDDDMFDFGRPSKSLIPLKEYLSYVVASIHKYGFVSKKQQEDSFGSRVATADDAIFNMYRARGHEPEYRPTDADNAEVIKALEWIKGHQGHLNDYLYNLQVVVSAIGIEKKHIGIAASLISAYHKAIGSEREKAAKKESAWQGTEGEKLTIKKAFVKMMTASPSMYARGKYTYFYILVDEDNNVYKYVSSQDLMEEGQTYDLAGTVKGHGEYNAAKQTVITRCKVTKSYESTGA